ncbi:hypothetical protein SDC9_165552 [bioreactor metagenome]|uniref:Uncharacterized protein n=1 Tax=bioreactor metagenome TaxID=1076179 RepID=A0A645G226_9ZZZZ
MGAAGDKALGAVYDVLPGGLVQNGGGAGGARVGARARLGQGEGPQAAGGQPRQVRFLLLLASEFQQ